MADEVLRDLSEVLRPHLTQEWQQLGDRFFRKSPVYARMGWYNPHDANRTIDLEEYITAVGPLGGAVAITRDTSQIRQVRGASEGRNVQIFSAAGFRMATIKWTGERIAGLAWTSTEQLIVLQEDGTATVYDIKGEFVQTFSFPEVRGSGVQKMVMSAGGEVMIVLSNDSRMYEVSSFINPRPKPLAFIDDTDQEGSGITALTVWSCSGGIVEVLAAAHGQLYVVDRERARPVRADGPRMKITAIAVSANEDRVALFHEGEVSVLSENFHRFEYTYNTETRITPASFMWCGSSAVVAYWSEAQINSEGLFVIPEDQSELPMTMTYYGPVILSQEEDGLRIITTETHEFFEEVPRVLQETFVSPRSGESKLFQARIAFEQRQAHADDLLRDVKESAEPDAMVVAINSLIEGAGHEWDQRLSRYLLKAARFGMDFIDVPSEDFMMMCKNLRVLQHVRDQRIGMPLTMTQYRHLSLEVLVDRLVNRGVYWLAHEICRFMKLESSRAVSRVLVHWASTVIQSHPGSDDVVADIIISKLRNTRGIKFVEIAKASWSRKELAIRLLDQEPRASEQVPMLLNLNEDELALQKALESGDTDLIYFVMTRLRDKMGSTGDFNRMIHNYPLASALYQQLCRLTDPEALVEYYHQHDLHRSKAYLAVKAAYDSETTADLTASLREALELYSQDKSDGGFMAAATEDQLRLITFQQKMASKHNVTLTGMSVSDTLFLLITRSDLASADMLRKQYKIPDKRFYWIKVKALAKAGDFAELERFAKGKSPIGYEPFVMECLGAHRPQEAVKYIAKLPKEQRVEFYLKAGKYNEACEAAAALRSEEAFESIVRYGEKHGRRDILAMVEKYRQ